MRRPALHLQLHILLWVWLILDPRGLQKTMNGRRAPSLSEQILSLTDPTPTERGEIDWFEEDETKAKVCDHVEEESIEQFSHLPPKKSLRGSMFDDDPRYAGKSVSRRTLDETWTSIDELGMLSLYIQYRQ